MPKIIAKLSHLDLDNNRFSDAMRLAIYKQMRLAARAFLSVAARAVPVRTGFARGAFGNLADAVKVGGAKGPNIDINTPAGAFLRTLQILRTHSFARSDLGKKSGLYTLSRRSLHQAGATGPFEYYRDGKRRILKTSQSGREFATNPNHVFEENNFVFSFNYEITISYFNINDFNTNPHTPSAPWNAFKAGRLTFLNYLRTQALDKLPRVSAFITETGISVSGSTITKTAPVFIDRATRFRI